MFILNFGVLGIGAVYCSTNESKINQFIKRFADGYIILLAFCNMAYLMHKYFISLIN